MYGNLLAEIHSKWFDSIPRSAAAHVSRLIGSSRRNSLVDLGCGSGILTKLLSPKFDRVFGIDISENMVALSKANLPSGNFTCQDILTAELPNSSVFTMVGEILSYASAGPDATESSVSSLFQRVHANLEPGGIFVLDVLGTNHDYRGTFFHDSEDFTVHSSVTQNDNIVSREIVSFLKKGEVYFKSIEEHRLKCFNDFELEDILREIGFATKRIFKYAETELLPGRIGFECRRSG